MTTLETRAPRRLTTCPGPRAGMPVAALIGALALAGCSSGNIGESWQCPLAKGGSCDSVAAADPAVPDAGGRTVLGEPLWQGRGSAPEARSETPCTTGCSGGFDPFGWLARLFGESNDGGGDRSTVGQSESATAATTGTMPGGPDREAEARLTEPEAAALPAEQPSLQAEPAAAGDAPQADDLRTNEVVARIWIAPFVDANGVYREASHVRVVLEAAGWRLP